MTTLSFNRIPLTARGNGMMPRRFLAVLIFCLVLGNGLYGQDNSQADQVTRKLQFVRGLMARSFHDMAVTELEAMLKAYPDDPRVPEITFYLIDSLRAQKREAQALTLVASFQSRWPAHALMPRLNLIKGDMLLRGGQADDAASALRASIGSDDPDIREAALFLLGQALEKQEKPAAALAAYKQLAALPFEDNRVYRPYAVLALARLNRAAGSNADADAAYRRLAETDALAAEIREEAMYRLAENAFNNADWKDAAAHFRTLRKTFPDSRFLLTAWKHELWSLVAEERFQEAVAVADEGGEALTGDVEACYLHGVGLMGVNDPAAALKRFEQVRNNAQAAAEYKRLATYQSLLACLELKQPDSIPPLAKDFVETFTDAPEIPDVLYLWARSLPGDDNHREQIRDLLTQALEKAPKDWPNQTHARLALAETQAILGKTAEAAGIYRALAEKTEGQDAAYYLLKAGDGMLQTGEIQRAVNDYRAALKAVPASSPAAQAAVVKIAQLYAENPDLGEPDAAIEELLTAATPDNRSQLLLLLGYSRFTRANYAAAEVPLRKVLENEKQGRVANQARNLLGAALLEQKKTDEALTVFESILTLPDAARPELTATILFRLLDLYFQRGDLEICQQITTLLGQSDNPATVQEASLRKADILLALNKPDQAIAVLQKLPTESSPDTPERNPLPPGSLALLRAMQGEAYLMLDDHDQALLAFEGCLDTPGLTPAAATRARWGMATILYREKRYDPALRHAVAAFVLGNDPRYTPKAMLLALEILIQQGKLDEAATTWRELRQRFPAASEQYRDHPAVQALPKLQ